MCSEKSIFSSRFWSLASQDSHILKESLLKASVLCVPWDRSVRQREHWGGWGWGKESKEGGDRGGGRQSSSSWPPGAAKDRLEDHEECAFLNFQVSFEVWKGPKWPTSVKRMAKDAPENFDRWERSWVLQSGGRDAIASSISLKNISVVWYDCQGMYCQRGTDIATTWIITFEKNDLVTHFHSSKGKSHWKKNTCTFEPFLKHLIVTFGALLLDKFQRVQSMNVAQSIKNAKRFLHEFAQTGKLWLRGDWPNWSRHIWFPGNSAFLCYQVCSALRSVYPPPPPPPPLPPSPPPCTSHTPTAPPLPPLTWVATSIPETQLQQEKRATAQEEKEIKKCAVCKGFANA